MATTKTPTKGSSSGRSAGGAGTKKTSTGSSKATKPASGPAAGKTATTARPAKPVKTGATGGASAKSAERGAPGKLHGMGTGAKIAAAAGVAAATAAAGVAAVRVVRRRIEDSQRTQIHLLPEGERWKVQIDGNATASSSHDTKDGALGAARKLAHQRAPSQLIIHRQDGTVQTRHSYNPNP